MRRLRDLNLNVLRFEIDEREYLLEVFRFRNVYFRFLIF